MDQLIKQHVPTRMYLGSQDKSLTYGKAYLLPKYVIDLYQRMLGRKFVPAAEQGSARTEQIRENIVQYLARLAPAQ